jgi:Cullin protein neddylation domain
MKFTNAAVRLQLIPTGVAKKAPSDVANETMKENDDIERERGAVIDSKIVAIMKTNKQFRHVELVPKVMEMISMFKAQPPMIKMRIEHLIKNDYMKRDDKDKSLYIYMP